MQVARATLLVAMLLAVVSAFGLTAPESSWAADPKPWDKSKPLVLGFLPSQRAAEITPDAQALAAFLEKKIGRKVEVVVPTAYEPLIEGLRFGHVHAAFLDGGPGWIAHNRTGAEVILAEEKDGATFYWAEAFVRADSPLKKLEDTKGTRVAFTSRTGSSGFLMPIGAMIGAGLITPKGNNLAALEQAIQGYFKSTIDAGGYKQALDALLKNRADVAFGAHDGPERFLSEEDRKKVRTLHRFGKIPSHAVMVAREVPADVKAKFEAAMLALNEPENLPLLKNIYGVDGLQKATTEGHLGEFGRSITNLPGIEQTLFNKAKK